VAPGEAQFHQLPFAIESAHPVVNRHFLNSSAGQSLDAK
jgi:hypothetical protein